MRTLITHHSEPHFLFNFHSLPSKSRKPTLFFHRKLLLNAHNTISSSISASCAANSAPSYSGWDDLRIRVESDDLGESNNIQKILISFGVYDKKYVFTCIVGFVCALAISRVRVSSIVVLPAAFIVFAVGFSFGFVNGRPNKGLSSNGAKMKARDDLLRVHVEKLKNLEDLFDGFDAKVSELKGCIEKAIESERVEVGDLEGYVNTVGSIGGLVVSARNVVEGCVESVSSEGRVEKNLYQKHNRKRKETGKNGFNLFGFVGNWFKGSATGSKPSKPNVVRRDSVISDSDNRGQEDTDGTRLEERETSLEANKITEDPRSEQLSDASRKARLRDRDKEIESILHNGRMNTMEAYMSGKMMFDTDDGLNYRNLRFTNNRRVSLNYREIQKWASYNGVNSKTEFGVNERNPASESSFNQQQMLRNGNGTYGSSRARDKENQESYASLQEEEMNIGDELHSGAYESEHQNEIGEFPSSSMSDDVQFDKCLTRASDLLKQAKGYLKGRNDETLAEEMLQESAKLLSQAAEMKPMSLLAIGQLGNIYLLHGELKLRTSRELRGVLSRIDDFGLEHQSDFLTPVDETSPRKDRIATQLVNVCEDCETLLVEAGRKYRMALAIDGNDVRAMYNWGLALFFRAQLIADIGPEAAVDADRLFLASIDKFDAMISRSNNYAPEALYRWGVALQQRSRLRPSNSRDKVKLLQQAKRLYEDALDMGKDNLQVKKALSSCMSELTFSDIQ